MSYFHLLPDTCHKRLIDGVTFVIIPGQTSAAPVTQVSSIAKDCIYKDLLDQFSEITRETILPIRPAYSVEHVIETSGPPIAARARRLPPDKLKAAKEEFDFMIQQGLCRPSKSPWAFKRKTAIGDPAVIIAD